MAGRVEWNGGALQARIRKEMGKRLAAASIMIRDHAKELISVAGTGSRIARVTDKKGRKRKVKVTVYGANPSRPGDPPHKQTGRLRGSVTYTVFGDSTRALVGTNVKYGRWLELGTARMPARPWIRRALQERKGVVQSILTKPMTGKKA